MTSTWFAISMYLMIAVCGLAALFVLREALLAEWRTPAPERSTTDRELFWACMQDLAVIFVLYCARVLISSSFLWARFTEVGSLYSASTGSGYDPKMIEDFTKI
ncbi:MAG: hypothetical protein AAFP68_03965 [Pseudomonadota bacterium]